MKRLTFHIAQISGKTAPTVIVDVFIQMYTRLWKQLLIGNRIGSFPRYTVQQ